MHTSLPQYLISFWCHSLTLWQWHLVFANFQITQPSFSQLNFENHWRDCQYLLVMLLILKDLHSFSPIFVPALLWQFLFQACLFLVFWLTKFVKVWKLSPIFCSGEQWQAMTFFGGNIPAWIIDWQNFPLFHDNDDLLYGVLTSCYSWLPNIPLFFHLLCNSQVC